MPQFDFHSYFIQFICLIIVVFASYFFYVRYILTGAYQVIKLREKLKEASLLFSKKVKTNCNYFSIAIKYFRNKKF